METQNQTSTSGKGLGIAALVIGIITLIWSLIPIFGAVAFWPSIIGLALGITAVIMAVKGTNPKKGIIIAGFILCIVSTGISTYWMVIVKEAADVLTSGLNIK